MVQQLHTTSEMVEWILARTPLPCISGMIGAGSYTSLSLAQQLVLQFGAPVEVVDILVRRALSDLVHVDVSLAVSLAELASPAVREEILAVLLRFSGPISREILIEYAKKVVSPRCLTDIELGQLRLIGV